MNHEQVEESKALLGKEVVEMLLQVHQDALWILENLGVGCKQPEIGLNARYVIDTFSVIDQDKVRIGMNESLSPGLVQPIDDDDYQCVIMPMRL